MSPTIVVVGGAGQMGSRAVRALVEQDLDVVVADRRPSAVDGAGFAQVDAGDPPSVAAAARAADIIMNFAGPYYTLGPAVARVAIALGTPYIDVCDDAEATEELLGLDAEARAADVPLVIGAGSSPGMINAMALRVAAGFDTLDELVLAWVVGERGKGSVSPLRHFLYGISRDIPVWRAGRRDMVPAFTADSGEAFPFPEPIGPVVVRDVGHPEPITLPRTLDVRAVRNKGALLPRGSTEVFDLLRRLGLTGEDAVEVDGARVVAGDFIATFLTERHNARAGGSEHDVLGLGLRATGTVDGRPVSRGLAQAATVTMADATALPTAAAIPLLLDGAVAPGVHGPEALDPERWFGDVTRIAPHLYGGIEIWEDEGPRVATSLAELAAVPHTGRLLEAVA